MCISSGLSVYFVFTVQCSVTCMKEVVITVSAMNHVFSVLWTWVFLQYQYTSTINYAGYLLLYSTSWMGYWLSIVFFRYMSMSDSEMLSNRHFMDIAMPSMQQCHYNAMPNVNSFLFWVAWYMSCDDCSIARMWSSIKNHCSGWQC